MYFVYILLSKSYKKTYTGITDNFERRINEHNGGSSTFTKRYRPWKLIHIEEVPDKTEAVKREKYLKSRSGRRWLKKNIFRE